MDEDSIFEDALNRSEESAAIESELNDIQPQIHEYRIAAVQAVEQNEEHNRKKKKTKLKHMVVCIAIVLPILFLISPPGGTIITLLLIILVTLAGGSLKYEEPDYYQRFMRRYR